MTSSLPKNEQEAGMTSKAPNMMTPLLAKDESVQVSENVKKVAIVGGGVAGICACRVLASRGFEITLFEAGKNLSGVWAQGYPGYGIQTPGKLYEFPDSELPVQKDFKDGLSISRYCQDYVKEHNLNKFAQLNTKVTAIVSAEKNKWTVTSECEGITTSEEFDFVILATGVYSPNQKFVPTIEGIENFEGNCYHSLDTAGITKRKGKKVIVVGYGKSSHDVVMNAAAETGVAPTLLFRSAHWCVPRKILGLIPMEWLLYSRFGQGTLPRWQECGPIEYFIHTATYPLIWVYWRIVQLILIGQLGLYGSSAHLRPTMPIEDDMYCGHGLIAHPDTFPMMHRKEIVPVKGAIKRILPSGKIQLDDGRELEADEIVFATGYSRDFSFLPKELLAKKEKDGFYSYRQMLVPGVPNIAFLNSNVTTFSNITTPGLQAAWLAEVLEGNVKLPKDAVEVVEKEKKWRRDNLKYAGNARAYLIQLHQIRYWDTLLCDMGAEVKRKHLGGHRVFGALQNLFEPVYSTDYRGIVTGEWKNDPSQVHKQGYKPSFLLEWSTLGVMIGALVMVLS